MRDQNGRLTRWGLPDNHFETDISSFFEPQPEVIPKVKYSNHYQERFGNTLGTVHLTKEGVEFVYFNQGSMAFERVKISPAHAHREESSCSTPKNDSSANLRKAYTHYSTISSGTVATCHDPSSYGVLV
jgi:hypothetical protein